MSFPKQGGLAVQSSALVCGYLKVSWDLVLVQCSTKYGLLTPALEAFQRQVSICCLFRGWQEREDYCFFHGRKGINVALQTVWSDFTKVQPTTEKTRTVFSDFPNPSGICCTAFWCGADRKAALLPGSWVHFCRSDKCTLVGSIQLTQESIYRVRSAFLLLYFSSHRAGLQSTLLFCLFSGSLGWSVSINENLLLLLCHC